MTNAEPTVDLASAVLGERLKLQIPTRLECKVLTLPAKNGTALRVRARVARCSEVAEGFYDMGACFTALAE